MAAAGSIPLVLFFYLAHVLEYDNGEYRAEINLLEVDYNIVKWFIDIDEAKNGPYRNLPNTLHPQSIRPNKRKSS